MELFSKAYQVAKQSVHYPSSHKNTVQTIPNWDQKSNLLMQYNDAPSTTKNKQ